MYKRQGEGNAERATSLLKELMEHYIVKRKYALDGLSTKELCSKLYEDMAGYSFLKKWIYKPGVEEVNINAYNDIEVIESSGRSIKIPDKFSSPQHAIDVIRRMLNACGMVIDDTMPSIVGFLDKNIRISVDKTPIVDADVGVNASIRIVNQQTVSEEKLLNSGSATAEMLHFLTACIRYGVSVCIAGSTGSGKTTIMAWLLSNVPNNRRLITIEEGSREFDLVKRDAQGNILNSVVHLLTRPSENPALNINQDFLLERVLRKHPDVIGVGEMRSAAESLSAAESSRTGHTVCTTIHSNSCNSTYRRMMTLAKRKYNMDDSILLQIMVEAYPIIVLDVYKRQMKKFFQSKGFIVSSLALLCVTSLGVCWFVSRDRTGDFRPDESPPSSVTGDWSDGGTQTDGDNGADAYAPGQSTDAEEEYPKVTSQTEDEVVIDFTDTEKPEETPPPVPEGTVLCISVIKISTHIQLTCSRWNCLDILHTWTLAV